MSDVKFHLNTTKAKQGTAINLVFCYSGKRIKMSTGYYIQPEFWNLEKQRVKEVMACQEAIDINQKLEAFRKLVMDINRKFVQQQIIPDEDSFKEAIRTEGRELIERKIGKAFWEIYDDFIESKRKEGVRDLVGYTRTLPKHLKVIEKHVGRPLTFSQIKEQEGGFVEIWDDYMLNVAENTQGEPGFSINTVGKMHKYLKTFLNWCFDRDQAHRFSLKHLPTYMEDIEAVYLNEKELEAIENIELTGRPEIVRDLFLVGCETGLRFSDYTRLNQGVFTDEYFNISPQKTRRNVADNRLVIGSAGQIDHLSPV